ncbi:MAG TPA: TetR/AcrR family transcriptional regulator [Xanthobacteraceae bacterium]|jgi:AcrR family transcriptional regulator
MANVDPIRRAEIGREKRARTRAQLLAAAHALFARQAVESVTVDDVVQEAGVAKGTFYVHFQDFESLTTAVADEVVKSMDDLLQPGRLSLGEPAYRIAFGCCGFIDNALSDPEWAIVLARMTTAAPKGGEIARRHLLEDLTELSKGLSASLSPALSLEIVVGMMNQLLVAFAEGRLSRRDRLPAIAAILRATGVDARQAKSALARLPAPRTSALPPVPGRSPRPRQRPARRSS